MGRGVHFHHKRKGHEQEPPAHGKHVPPKQTERVEYEIGTVATEDSRNRSRWSDFCESRKKRLTKTALLLKREPFLLK